MLKILLAGNDLRLLATRAAVLAKTGTSILCCSAMEALDILERGTFGLVVLCHSLSVAEVGTIADKVHQHGHETKILLVVSLLNKDELDQADRVDGYTLPEPTRLIARATELLQGTVRSSY